MTMENDDQKIDDVDEMFESFVKKKLQQLGIKKAKDERNGAMSELERNMKLRLEKNMADGSKVKKLEHQSEAQTVEEETENWVESSPKVKKSKKDKKEKKKKKKKDKDDKKERNKKPDSKHHKMRHDEKSKDKVEKKDPKTEEVTSVSDKTREQESAKSSGQDVSTNDKKNLPTNGISTAPKKDIATIKMKIELLKAKSEGERLQEEMNGMLKNATKDDENDNTEVKKEEQEQINEKGVKTEKEISRSRSPLKKSTHSFRKRSKSGSKSPSKKSRRHTKSRSRSPSRRSKHSRHRSRSRSRSRSRRHRGHRSRSRSRERRRRSRSRSRERRHRKRSRRSSSPLISTKDKVRLLEIAKANALAQHKATYTASSVTSMGGMLKSSSMSVTQLTEICKDIASGKEEPSPLSITDEPLTKEKAEQLIDNVNAATVHHPFAVRETPITFNIKPVKMATPAPPPVTKALATLTKEFPVSCGQQHRRKEVLETVYGKWEAVAKDEATKNAVKELVNSDKVFLEEENEPPEVDLSSAIADRISAVRQLQDNPASQEAKERMDQAQKRLDSWTKKKQAPGQFTGHTGLTAMPKSVLESGRQAWFKADDLKNAKKVDGIGKSLLQKMGWTPGTPLGKTMLGQLEPLQLDMKNDRRGLSSFMEVTPSAASLKKGRSAQQNGPKPGIRAVVDLSCKHPVSALMEICSKRHWPLPDFHLTDPCNIKSFTYRVTIRNDEYVGHPANNKKQAKLSAATVALQCMGLLPKNPA